jgi:hypothetical protein
MHLPQRRRLIKEKNKNLLSTVKIFLKIRIPIPPSFRRTPAKIIDPIIGAST